MENVAKEEWEKGTKTLVAKTRAETSESKRGADDMVTQYSCHHTNTDGVAGFLNFLARTRTQILLTSLLAREPVFQRPLQQKEPRPEK